MGGIQNQTSSLPVGGDQQLPGGVAMPGGAPPAEGGKTVTSKNLQKSL